MKRIISLLLSVMMVFGLATTAFAATIDQSVSTTAVKAGESVTVTLTMTEGYEQLMYSFGCQVFYNPDLFVLTGTKNGDITSYMENSDPGYDKDFGGTYIRVWFEDPKTEGVVMNAGTLYYLTFTALEDLTQEEAADFQLVFESALDETFAEPIGDVVTAKLTVTVSPASAEPEEPVAGYTVAASADQTVSAGETAQVAVTVSASDAEKYNAYDLSLTYDTDKLTFVSGAAADPDASVEEDNGSIRVKGYGADKHVGTAAVTLTFTAKAVGAAEVTIASAKVDIGNHAIDNDAPDATILDDTTVITISGYSVTLGEGLTGPSVAAPNEDYTFSATDADHYDYVVTATMGGEDVSVTDNGDGTYTISDVTGDLVISAAMTPKSYTVTVNGTGKADVTAADTATYNTDYSFTVTEDSGYTYTVSATVGGESYTLGAPENGTYTIPGTDVTGDIVITVNKEAKPVTTVSVTKPDYVIGSSTAEKGQDYPFSINKEDGYNYGDPVVTVGGVDITENLIQNADGSYTIPGAYVTDDITIEVTRTAAVAVDVTEYITLDGQSIFLVTASGTFAEGSIAKYDGMSMFWSDQYNAYAYLVVSTENLETVKAEAAEKVAIAEGTAAGTVDYTGDVNGTGVIDVNDAQLTYDMYNAKYSDFDTVSMLKFLNADVNADKTVNVADAAAIIAAIQ